MTAKELIFFILISIPKCLKIVLLFIAQLEHALFASAMFRNVDKFTDIYFLCSEFYFKCPTSREWAGVAQSL